ncbi:hypothetical protein [Spirosoma utsteinense]|uniref:Uncharacterized protein n=1 Tax=Spirosoma utsteinense TaxID=2585773 RepID=A0ABR6W6G3_9BACT|nr:hypothetical protein [Spirosoma utsteinense]MBC3787919.1 hypothetical protein [Spirosoma utsteinense]MBC3792158.1 hypothetical protein [Spirosoma utsteinense]
MRPLFREFYSRNRGTFTWVQVEQTEALETVLGLTSVSSYQSDTGRGNAGKVDSLLIVPPALAPEQGKQALTTVTDSGVSHLAIRRQP